MKSVFCEVIIITNEPELYEFLGAKTYKDIYTNVGPIAGIHTGLTHSKTEKNFVISCDMPLINANIIKSIIEYPGNTQVKVPFADGFLQQLCGLYSKTLLNLIDSVINTELEETRDKLQEKRKCKVHQLINKAESIIIRDVENHSGYNENVFLNMNYPEEYNKIVQLIT
jgi:molybdopterin-guanine dinucleotide biosynthesis protein A